MRFIRVICYLTVVLFGNSFAGEPETKKSLNAPAKPALMPYPAKIKWHSGHLEVADSLVVESDNLSLEKRKVINSLLGSLGLKTSSDKQSNAVLDIQIANANLEAKTPRLGNEESYRLKITSTGISLTAPEYWGVLHGVQTLRQLYQVESQSFPLVTIEDAPRFPWRGLLIDSVRHFIPVTAIKRQLDGMASAKLNVFHWHLTDDQGWRIPVKGYPKLIEKASDGLFYSHAQIKDIVAYASSLGIRVVPEVDFPGHASAIAVAYPEFMSMPGDYQMQREWGVFEPLLDPSNPDVFVFIDAVFSQLSELFPDEYVHIGGDEVKPTQWLQSEKVQAYMAQNHLETPLQLHTHFNHKLQKMLSGYGKKMMGWDEILDAGLDKNVIIQSWRGLHSLKGIVDGGFQGLLSNGFYIDQAQYADYHYRNDPIATIGHEAPLEKQLSNTSAWKEYQFQMPRLKGSAVQITLWLPESGEAFGFVRLNQHPNRWARDVKFEGAQVTVSIDTWMGPLDLHLTLRDGAVATSRAMIGNTAYPLQSKANPAAISSEQARVQYPTISKPKAGQILGGEATLWAELVNQNNIDRRTWPRLYVIAERFWSPAAMQDTQFMYQRLWAIDDYAQDIVGLEHHQQLVRKVNELMSSEEERKALLTVLEMLEPAQYYTRHHIHYQQDMYHQLADINKLVDVLPVQSQAMYLLQTQIEALGSNSFGVESKIEGQLMRYRDALRILSTSLPEELTGLAALLTNSVERGLFAIQNCKPAENAVATQSNGNFGNSSFKALRQRAEIIPSIALHTASLQKYCLGKK